MSALDSPKTYCYLACRKYKNYYNDKGKLDVYKFDYKIPKTANEITKISRTAKKVLPYLQKQAVPKVS